MRRIYFLAPNIEITHKIVDELRTLGIEDHHLRQNEEEFGEGADRPY